LALLLNEPTVALFVCALTLLLPLTLANRWVADRRYRVWAVVALAVTSASFATDFESAHFAALLKVAILAGLVLVAFWRGDFLSAVVAANLFVVGYAVALLAPLGGDWPGVVRYVVMVAVMTGVLAVGIAYKGRELTEEEVRPKYAERLLERLGLQAEVSAAREAQLRLLPTEAPEVPGWKLRASCTPSKEVGGDFYDFFPLRNGGVGILVAEGGSTGLASALSIGLAKGFLLYASEKSWTAGEALRRLRPVLLRAVKGNIERLGLAYLTVDASGAARVARFGTYPKIWELTAGAAPREIEPLGVAGEDFVGERSVKLGEHSLLLLVTDGLVERLREKTALALPDWIEKRGVTGAAALQAALVSEIGSDFDDDITMVLAERQAPALGLREGVA
jgi:hypothetical protein